VVARARTLYRPVFKRAVRDWAEQLRDALQIVNAASGSSEGPQLMAGRRPE
jgi:hypothetical protein